MERERRVAFPARCRLTTLAKICAYLENVGESPRSRSELVHLGLEILANSIEGDEFTVEEANTFLEERGFSWDKGSPNHKIVVKNLQKETNAADELDKLARRLMQK